MTIGDSEDDYNPPLLEDDEEDENGEPLAPPQDLPGIEKLMRVKNFV
jgi:hypothetical protein